MKLNEGKYENQSKFPNVNENPAIEGPLIDNELLPLKIVNEIEKSRLEGVCSLPCWTSCESCFLLDVDTGGGLAFRTSSYNTSEKGSQHGQLENSLEAEQ